MRRLPVIAPRAASCFLPPDNSDGSLLAKPFTPGEGAQALRATGQPVVAGLVLRHDWGAQSLAPRRRPGAWPPYRFRDPADEAGADAATTRRPLEWPRHSPRDSNDCERRPPRHHNLAFSSRLRRRRGAWACGARWGGQGPGRPLSRPGRRGMTPSVYYNLEQKFKITKLGTKISEPQVRTLFSVAVPSSTFAASAARDGQSQFRPSWSVWRPRCVK